MDQLSELFAAYRAAVPDPEPGPDFMPGLWQRIEARRTFSPVAIMRRFAQVFAAAALAMALLVGAVVMPRMQSAPVYSATYVDVLANAHDSDLPDSEPGR